MLLLYIYMSRASEHFLYADRGIAVGGILLSYSQSLRATVAQPESDRPGQVDKLAGDYHLEISRRQQFGVCNRTKHPPRKMPVRGLRGREASGIYKQFSWAADHSTTGNREITVIHCGLHSAVSR